MTLVAQFMNAHCGGMQVIAAHAYSSTGWKRKIQQIFR
jgi:hypothetical protein